MWSDLKIHFVNALEANTEVEFLVSVVLLSFVCWKYAIMLVTHTVLFCNLIVRNTLTMH